MLTSITNKKILIKILTSCNEKENNKLQILLRKMRLKNSTIKITIPIQIVELEDDNYHLIISSELSGLEKSYWVIDTGASKTVFDKNLKSEYCLSDDSPEEVHTAGIGGMILESAMAEIKEVAWGKLKIQNFKTALIDLSSINDLYSKAANLKICGLLGGDFLMKYKAVIDYRKKALILYAETDN